MKATHSKFTLAEKLAVVNVIYATIHADEVVHQGEITYLGKLMKTMDFDSNFILQARNMEMDQSMVLLRDMTFEKRRLLAEILENVALSDGFIHTKEKELLHTIFSSLGVLKKAR
ncbi:MAG: TerB family tellurite resistance protein [Bacteroidota bacterium]